MRLSNARSELRRMQWQYKHGTDDTRKLLGPRMDALALAIDQAHTGINHVRFVYLRKEMSQR